MTVFAKELKQSVKAWCIWTGAISFLLFICIIMFPEMKNEMDEVSSVFANMGGFTSAFGMDKLSFGELMGFSASSVETYSVSAEDFLQHCAEYRHFRARKRSIPRSFC